MKVLVVGANGQVGSELLLQGKENGIHMIAANHKQLDITQTENVVAFLNEAKPDLVINAAAYTAVDNAERESKTAFSVNRDGALNLAMVCNINDIPIFHLSTDYVFDGLKCTPYCEGDMTNPKNIYGISKRDGEIAIVNTTTQYLILRVAWVFGSRGHNFVRTILRLANERDELRVVSDQFGSPTWSVDIANALINIAIQYFDKKELQWGIFHYVGKPVASWYEFAVSIINMAYEIGKLEKIPSIIPISTAEYSTPARRPQNTVLDCHKIYREFHIQQPNWHDGLNLVLKSIYRIT